MLNSAATTRGLEGKNRGSQVRVGARQLSYTILYSLTRGVCGGVERSSSRRGPFPQRTRRRVNSDGLNAFRRVLNPSTRALRCEVSGTLGLPPPAVEIRSVMHHGAANEKTIVIINRRRRRRRREGGRIRKSRVAHPSPRRVDESTNHLRRRRLNRPSPHDPPHGTNHTRQLCRPRRPHRHPRPIGRRRRPKPRRRAAA